MDLYIYDSLYDRSNIMTNQPAPTKAQDHGVTLRKYVIGFVISLMLTLMAYLLVTQYLSSDSSPISRDLLIIALAVLAMTQFVAQLVLFLHLGTETRPRWRLMVFWFMIVTVLILVVGSLWIMQNLNYYMMSADDATNYINRQQGF